MKQSFELSGLHCQKCVARAKKALETIAEEAEVVLSPPMAVLTVKEPLTVEEVNKALSEAGDYKAVALD